MRIVVSDKAGSDLLRLYAYLEPRNPDAAERVIRRIDQRLAQLAQFPFIGRPRPSLGAGVRGLIADAHLIFYTVQAEQITAVRVIDSRMDIDAEFRR